FDVVHTSELIRAQRTARIVMSHNKSSKNPPVHHDQRLNERHYGSLQGLDKDETRQKFGAEQVHIWRRSFDIPPPDGESLEMCAKRTLPYLNEEIEPDLQSGKNVLVAAHGNSLRSIVMSIENLTPDEILSVEIPTGVPIHYQYENGKYSRIN
ncbi:MAG: 2,3-bisphosphoglycerate-dependent phosphoglycerate mutase, partial [Candidatus Thermoplasmatota archaeon]|nr:2,3-bisphosphoglycerate-dependent phosphoglycerate mutase [Candidatus Thermoplasmatota archaeon]